MFIQILENTINDYDNNLFVIKDCNLYGIYGKYIPTDGHIDIPEGVTSIMSWAAENCSKLKTITLPSTLLYIEAHSFENSGLTSITIPKSVKIIDYSAFIRCKYLTNILIQGDLEYIDVSSFAYCSKLKNIQTTAHTQKLIEQSIIDKINMDSEWLNKDYFSDKCLLNGTPIIQFIINHLPNTPENTNIINFYKTKIHSIEYPHGFYYEQSQTLFIYIPSKLENLLYNHKATTFEIEDWLDGYEDIRKYDYSCNTDEIVVNNVNKKDAKKLCDNIYKSLCVLQKDF